MKKFTVCGAAVALCCLASNVQAQEPEYPASASTEVFDFTPWNDDQLLLLFAHAADEGRKYPTKEEFEAAGFNLDLEFSRSHVRPAVIMEDAAKNVVADVYPTLFTALKTRLSGQSSKRTWKKCGAISASAVSVIQIPSRSWCVPNWGFMQFARSALFRMQRHFPKNFWKAAVRTLKP